MKYALGLAFAVAASAAFARNFNPILPDWIADPSVSRFGDAFYLYGTTDIDKELNMAGVPVVWKSKDFVNWSFEGPAIEGVDWQKGIETRRATIRAACGDRGTATCSSRTAKPCRSPHVAKVGRTVRYLRLSVTAGDPGVWEMKVFGSHSQGRP